MGFGSFSGQLQTSLFFFLQRKRSCYSLQAEVTGGGIPLSELNCSTMQSRKLEGLYLCGEICDVFGRIGGFNFYWAWLSGRLAGVSAALDA